MENGGQKDEHHFPWLFENTVQIYRYFAKLHHQLVPYFYSYDIQAHSDGISICRPIGADTNYWKEHWEYLLGDNLFISAIASSGDSKEISFPAGKWINYWNEDEVYNGGTPATLTYPLNQYPIFIRSGAIIPMNVDDPETGHGSDSSKNYLTLLIYPDGVSSFDYHSDPFTTTRITSEERCGGIVISFNSYTDSVIIRLKNEIEPESVYLSGSLSLQKKNSFAEFEGPSPGWFHGQIRSGENIYTWIKFSSPNDTVYVTTSSVSEINPQNYEVSKLIEGNKYYIDRDYVLDSIPDEFEGYYMIKTANNDKAAVGLDFHFNLCSRADLYIAYDQRISPPDWLTNNYNKTDKVITTTDPYFNNFDIWRGKTALQDTVNLGDNGDTAGYSMYFVFYKSYTTQSSISVKVFLQGPYSSGSMSTALNPTYLPLSQPYNNSPWSYSGTESVSSIPSGVVDWVLIQLRSTYNGTTVATRAAFLKSNGDIVDLDGTSPVDFIGISPGDYYIVVKHRNHLAVMSASAVTLPNISVYDFTDSQSKAYVYNSDGMVSLGGTPEKFGMFAGDANKTGAITVGDLTSAIPQLGTNGYNDNDMNMSGAVTVGDLTIAIPNLGKSTQVPN
jgi:hypothetical protein